MNKIMKNIYLILLSFTVLVGCTNSNTDNQLDEINDSTSANTNDVEELERIINGNSVSSIIQILPNDSVKAGQLNGDSILIPDFEIEVLLTKKALARLDKESVIVQAYFSGQPSDTTSQEYLDEGSINLGSKDIELWDSRVASFRDVKISRAAYEKLSDKNFEVLINVYSDRHTTTDNLISCGIIQENIDDIKGKKHLIKGDLI